jgi:diguanylate cyclase (GGDEF)-like protein
MRIVIAEDDPVSRRVLESTLNKWHYDVVAADNGDDAWRILSGPDAPRLAILDWMMPGLSGTDICKQVRQLEQGRYYYLILLTSRGTKEDIIEGLDAGADDYLVKPFDSRELRVRVRCGRRILDLQQELISARDALQVQATHDGLTGLLNRAAIFEELHRVESRCRREGAPFTVVMVDLDHFKAINDNYGHAAGDTVLREAARRMKSELRGYDMLGRYGGEEFLVLLPNASMQEGGRVLAERIRHAMQDYPFPVAAGQGVTVTASLGVVSNEDQPERSTEQLVKLADEALYHAKETGRNKVVLASQSQTV